MTDHTRPLWADLPTGDEITALLDELRTLSPDEARAIDTAWGAVPEAAWRVAGSAAEGVARRSAARGTRRQAGQPVAGDRDIIPVALQFETAGDQVKPRTRRQFVTQAGEQRHCLRILGLPLRQVDPDAAALAVVKGAAPVPCRAKGRVEPARPILDKTGDLGVLLGDAVAPGLLVAQAVGRLGNWFNQELYGAPTTLPWGLKLNMEGSAIGHSEQCYDGATCPTGTLFHPTFLYEMIWNLIGAALIVFLGSKIMKKLKAGSLFAIYIMWYTAGRTWIEALRIDFAHEFLGVRINVWVSMAVFVLGVVAFIVIQQMGKSTELLAEKLRTVTEIELSLVEDGETGLSTAKANLTKTKDEITANDGSSVSYADDQSDNK